MYQPTEVTFIDPRTFDGNPYEVAALALGQAEGILKIYRQALDAAYLMARNAAMERNIAEGKPPAGDKYRESPQGLKFLDIDIECARAAKALTALKQAASYDPKHPPRVGA